MIYYNGTTKELNGLAYRTLKLKRSEFIEAELFFNWYGLKFKKLAMEKLNCEDWKQDVLEVQIEGAGTRLFFRLSKFKKLAKVITPANESIFYIIQFESGFIKIGISSDYKSRLKNYESLEAIMNNKIIKLDVFKGSLEKLKKAEKKIICQLDKIYQKELSEWFKTSDFDNVRRIVMRELF